MSNLKYVDAQRSAVVETLPSGAMSSIPCTSTNKDWAKIVADGNPISDFIVPATTADDVRAEAQRRLMLLLGARNAAHLQIKIMNGLREATRLESMGRLAWGIAEETRADELYLVDVAIEAIRDASNAMEAAPPADFADDRHWPQLSVS